MQLFDIDPFLQPYVRDICSMEVEPGTAYCPSFRVLPDTRIELFVNYSRAPLATIPGKTGEGHRGSFLVSRMSQYMDVQMQPGTGCIAVCFYPGQAYRFFSMPMSEISNEVIPLGACWEDAAALEEKVGTARTNSDRVLIIQQFLLEKLYASEKREAGRLRYCLGQIHFYKGQLSVRDLSQHANLSERQLNRHFNSYVGLSPKEFTKVSRFIHSLAHLRKYPPMSLTEIAYESGYYDQAHFVHDYQQYAGFSPGELLTLGNVLY